MEQIIKTNMTSSSKLAGVICLIAFVLAWLFLGVLKVEGENEIHQEIFIKAKPTFQVNFSNPYRSEPHGEEHEYAGRMDASGDWLPGTVEFKSFVDYCKYRYGVVEDDPAKLPGKCGKRE